MKDAGSPQQVASAVAAFQHKPTWKAAVLALKKQRIKRKDMAEELAKELQMNAGSLMNVISAIKKGGTKPRASDLLLGGRTEHRQGRDDGAVMGKAEGVRMERLRGGAAGRAGWCVAGSLHPAGARGVGICGAKLVRPIGIGLGR